MVFDIPTEHVRERMKEENSIHTYYMHPWLQCNLCAGDIGVALTPSGDGLPQSIVTSDRAQRLRKSHGSGGFNKDIGNYIRATTTTTSTMMTTTIEIHCNCQLYKFCDSLESKTSLESPIHNVLILQKF